jgi:hypothetical protein
MIGRRAGGWLVSVIALVGLVWAPNERNEGESEYAADPAKVEGYE